MLHIAKQYIKFEISSFNRSRDILGGLKIYSGLRCHKEAHLRVIYHPFGNTYLCTKVDDDSFSRS